MNTPERDAYCKRRKRRIVVTSIVRLKGTDLVINAVASNDLLEHICYLKAMVALKDL
jgi:hypothetical protein